MILLTGASGFIGSNLKEALKRYDLRLLMRKVGKPQEEIIHGTLSDQDSLDKAAKGCDTIIHCAAKADDWGSYYDFHKVNVLGTRNLLKAASKNKIKKFILISTTAVLGEESNLSEKNENYPYNPLYPYFMNKVFPSAMNHYRYTKMLQEKEVIGFCKKNDIRLLVIRPVWTFGPGELHSGPYYFARSRMKNRFFPAKKGTLFHTIYVKDLCQMIRILIEKDIEGIYIAGAGCAATIDQFWEAICKELGKDAPTYIPKHLAYPIGFASELLYAILDTSNPPLLTRARVDMGYSHNVYDVKKMHEQTRVRETPLKVAIAETVRWWKENGYL